MNFNPEKYDPYDEESMNEFFDDLTALFNDVPEQTYTSIVDKKKVDALAKAAEMVKASLLYKTAKVSVVPYSEETELGLIKIRSKDLIVFKNPSVLSSIGRSAVGIDFTAYVDGTNEVVISFHTAERLG